jgi:hypothetical protein
LRHAWQFDPCYCIASPLPVSGSSLFMLSILSMSVSNKSKGISLGEKTRWVIKGLSDYEPFFRHLHRMLPESGAILYFEGIAIAPDVRKFLQEHSVGPAHEVLRGTIWPKPSIFHLPASPDVLRGLADLASHHAYPEITNHCHVYTKDGMILQWFDACDPGCPIGAGATITEESVKAFCDLAGAEYCTYTNG